jgi:hypothetical protein
MEPIVTKEDVDLIKEMSILSALSADASTITFQRIVHDKSIVLTEEMCRVAVNACAHNACLIPEDEYPVLRENIIDFVISKNPRVLLTLTGDDRQSSRIRTAIRNDAKIIGELPLEEQLAYAEYAVDHHPIEAFRALNQLKFENEKLTISVATRCYAQYICAIIKDGNWITANAENTVINDLFQEFYDMYNSVEWLVTEVTDRYHQSDVFKRIINAISSNADFFNQALINSIFPRKDVMCMVSVYDEWFNAHEQKHEHYSHALFSYDTLCRLACCKKGYILIYGERLIECVDQNSQTDILKAYIDGALRDGETERPIHYDYLTRLFEDHHNFLVDISACVCFISNIKHAINIDKELCKRIKKLFKQMKFLHENDPNGNLNVLLKEGVRDMKLINKNPFVRDRKH